MTASKPYRPADGESATAPLGKVPRVLVAEDNKLNSILIAEQLRALGCEAEIHASGLHALERWRSGGFAAVLTDVNMPGMGGFELAAAIRAEEADGHRTPIIAWTADAFLHESAAWKRAGVDACLTKPIELPSLKAALDRWIPTRVEVATSAANVLAADAPIDRATLPRIIGDDPRLNAEFLTRFSQAAEAAAATMASALRSGCREEVGSHAHQLRASAAAVGAASLSRLCASIESAAAAPDEGDLAAAWEPFPAEVRRVTEWISAQAAERGAAKADAAPR